MQSNPVLQVDIPYKNIIIKWTYSLQRNIFLNILGHDLNLGLYIIKNTSSSHKNSTLTERNLPTKKDAEKGLT